MSPDSVQTETIDTESMRSRGIDRLEPLISVLRHEIGNPLNVIQGHLELYRESPEKSGFSGLNKEEYDNLKSIVEVADYIERHAEDNGKVPEKGPEKLLSYAKKSSLEGPFEEKVERIAKVTEDVFSYQQRILEAECGERVSIAELLEPLENSANALEAESQFDYGGLEDETPKADNGLRIVFWTLGKNWEEHAYEGKKEPELGLKVSESQDVYEVDVWNTGAGLFDENPVFEGKSVEHRYREAYELIESEDKGGLGLSMASSISEVYDAELMYSEEMLDKEKGFGIKVDIPKY